MAMSKNEDIEKDNNDKDKQYQKREVWYFHFSENWEK